ncbi:glucosaminidase domain-containing protein [Pelagibacteraceae bacterium]|nr:glucosaminidase domain-containing protein [Pelagibacteraceae bacterium]
MRNLFIFTFFSFLLASITTIAFEERKELNDINILYKLNADLDDLVFNYCSSYDSYTVNRIYSQKKIIDNNLNKIKSNKLLVSIKKKPLDLNVIKLIDKKHNVKFLNRNISEIELEFLSDSKKDFVKTLLPLISYENQNILLERSKLESIKSFLNNNKTLESIDINFLIKISKKYRIKTNDKHKYDLVNELLELVDVIPNSIVLAQAANESGWGTSRFAREFNALFGEYTYDFSNGVIPLMREEGAKHLVKSFESVDKSVQSYFTNLNTHYAYKDFRDVRKVMRKNNNFSNVELLVNELDTYAADKNYINTINSIIEDNKLQKFDTFTYSYNNS